jgi:methylated-DNA-[protein]-cysteine S-methyltransferase
MSVAAPSADALGYALFETALGTCAIAWAGARVTRFRLPGASRDALHAGLRRRGLLECVPPAGIAAVIAGVQRYMRGERVDFEDVSLGLDEQPAFQRAVYDACRAIPWGETVSYGELAARVGAGKGAARAVGQAMGANPIPLIVPCHRVLAAGRRIGGFSAPGGARAKERMLALEGVTPGDGTPLLPGLLDPVR